MLPLQIHFLLSELSLPLIICDSEAKTIRVSRGARIFFERFGLDPQNLPKEFLQKLPTLSVGESIQWPTEKEKPSGFSCSYYPNTYDQRLFFLEDLKTQDHPKGVSEEIHFEHLSSMKFLSSNVANELLSPLGSILYSLEGLLSRPGISEDSRLEFEQMMHSAVDIQRSVECLTDHALQRMHRSVYLPEVCENVVGALRPSIRQGAHSITWSVHKDAEWVRGNIISIELLLSNLLNPFFATTIPAQVKMMVEKKGDKIELRIFECILNKDIQRSEDSEFVSLITPDREWHLVLAKESARSFGGLLVTMDQSDFKGFLLTLCADTRPH